MGKMHIITHVNVNPRFLISHFSHVSFDTKQVHILGRCWYNNLHPSFLPSFLSPLKKRIKNKWNPNGYLQPVTEFKGSHPLICTHHESKYFRINIMREQRVFFILQQQIHRYKGPPWMSFLGILSFQRSQHNPLFPSSVTVETTWFLLCFAWRYTRSYYHSCSVTWENSTTHRYSCVHFLRGWVCLQAVYQADLCNTTEKEEHRCEVKSSWINICCSLERCCVRACKTGNSRCTLW